MKKNILFIFVLSFSCILFSGDVEDRKNHHDARVHSTESVTASIAAWQENKSSVSHLGGIAEVPTEPVPHQSICCDCSSAMSRMSKKCKDCVKVVWINYGCFGLCCRKDVLCCCLRCSSK